MSAKHIDDNIILLDNILIDQLIDDAKSALLRRSRYCFHNDSSDTVQEMVIAICNDSAIAPHRHNGRPESLTILRGNAIIAFFNDDSSIEKCVNFGKTDNQISFIRINGNCWHTLIPLSDVVVIHEVCRGPYIPENTVLAPWSPDTKSYDTFKLFADKIRTCGVVKP